MQAAALREQELRPRTDPWATGRAPQPPPAAPNDRVATRTRHPRRPRRLKRVALTIVLVLAVGLVGGGILLWQRVGAFNAAVSTAPLTSAALWGPLGGADRVNVAFFGYAGDPNHGGEFLSDSINILSIDPKTNRTALIAIPRDLWIEGDPALPDNGKINEAFAAGWQRGGVTEGGRAATGVLSRVLGLRIDHWMAMDFAGFRDMVTAVGGVTVDNPTAFKYTWYEQNFHAGVWEGGSFAKGVIHLNGDQALSYTRARYTSVPAEASDFARSVRQERVLNALKSKLGEGGLGSIGPGLALMDALKGRLKTDLSAIDLALLSSHLKIDQRLELKEDVILRATTNSVGAYVLVVIGQRGPSDYSPLQRYVAAQLAAPPPSSSPSPGR